MRKMKRALVALAVAFAFLLSILSAAKPTHAASAFAEPDRWKQTDGVAIQPDRWKQTDGVTLQPDRWKQTDGVTLQPDRWKQTD